jgi:transposase-like protein
MSTTHQRPGSKERFWRRMVRQWRRSGLSVRAFCRLHDLSEPSMYAWRRTLAQRDADTFQFVPVEVVPEEPSHAVGDGDQGRLELVLRDRRRLRIAPGFDADTLRQVLAVLEELPC